ncbi:MAG: acyl carrier protein [Calditrichaeota bacterium]|nr:MAG: acyl carrier protein [Calditrichota bacterium]
MATTLERVKNITAELLKIDPSIIQKDSRFVEDLGAESIQSIELVAAFDEEFDIEMDEDEALSVKSVGDAVTFIDRYLEG